MYNVYVQGIKWSHNFLVEFFYFDIPDILWIPGNLLYFWHLVINYKQTLFQILKLLSVFHTTEIMFYWLNPMQITNYQYSLDKIDFNTAYFIEGH
jgi:hypothetical protein